MRSRPAVVWLLDRTRSVGHLDLHLHSFVVVGVPGPHDVAVFLSEEMQGPRR